MPKKQRRVSFLIPEQDPKDEEEEQHINISTDGDPVDDEVETIQDDASSQSPQESERESDSESASDEIPSEDERGDFQREPGTETELQQLATEREHRSDPESDSENATNRRRRRASKTMESNSSSPGPNSVSEADSSGESEDSHSTSSSDSDRDSDEDDEENEISIPEEKETADGKPPAPVNAFSEMSLDPRVERAIERMGWLTPTPVQSAVIPSALAGRDVLVTAPTGSGKTAAYAIPVVQRMCRESSTETASTRCVVLVPTRELVHQVTNVIKRLCKYIDGVSVVGITRRDRHAAKPGQSLRRAADVLVATPSAVLATTAKDEERILKDVELVIVDEADLVLSYGYEKDARMVLSQIASTAQSLLLSATLEADGIESFRKVVLRRPLTIKVTAGDTDKEGDQTGATHYYARLKNHQDRYLVTYAMLRLNVICGKVLIFVEGVNSAFRLKLFLDQFKLKTAVLNSELPANSRIHCVEQFNAGVFEILIATDEVKRDVRDSKKTTPKTNDGGKKRKRTDKDDEYGLSRGVDFRDVAAVFNFDQPQTHFVYTHRAGRTARAGKSGTVLTLVCDDKEERTILETGKQVGAHIGPLAFRMEQIEALRYRVESSLRLVTDTAIHGARLADVRREIVNSETLKDYFEDNPEDLDALQHNLTLAKRIPDHLGHIPSYLLPPALRASANNGLNGKRYTSKKQKRSDRQSTNGRKKQSDPLKSLSMHSVSGSSRYRYRAKHGIKTKKKDLGQTMKKRRRTH